MQRKSVHSQHRSEKGKESPHPHGPPPYGFSTLPIGPNPTLGWSSSLLRDSIMISHNVPSYPIQYKTTLFIGTSPPHRLSVSPLLQFPRDHMRRGLASMAPAHSPPQFHTNHSQYSNEFNNEAKPSAKFRHLGSVDLKVSGQGAPSSHGNLFQSPSSCGGIPLSCSARLFVEEKNKPSYNNVWQSKCSAASTQIIDITDNEESKHIETSITIGKIRRYDAQAQKYGPWEKITIPIMDKTTNQSASTTSNATFTTSTPTIGRDHERNSQASSPCQRGTSSHTIHLKRGGKVTFLSNILPPNRRKAVLNDMKNCKLFRQYHHNRSGVSYPEPRLHVLLSSDVIVDGEIAVQQKDKNESHYCDSTSNVSTTVQNEVVTTSFANRHIRQGKPIAFNTAAWMTPMVTPAPQTIQKNMRLVHDFSDMKCTRENGILHPLCSGGGAPRHNFSSLPTNEPEWRMKPSLFGAQRLLQHNYGCHIGASENIIRNICYNTRYDSSTCINYGGSSDNKMANYSAFPLIGYLDGMRGQQLSPRYIHNKRCESDIPNYPGEEMTRISKLSAQPRDLPLRTEESSMKTLKVSQHQGSNNSLSPEKTNICNASPGYIYHLVSMKAKPLNSVPEVESLAHDLAVKYGLPNNTWNVGVNMIIYRDGHDNIGWHADDTQGESLILSVVVDSGEDIRPVKVRPKKQKKQAYSLSHGDEELELYIQDGDGYVMDGDLQKGYEHSVPKMTKIKSNRFVIIFRQGINKVVNNDSGTAQVDLTPPLRVKKDLIFDHPNEVIVEGRGLYPRCVLINTHSHGCDRRGVSGNKEMGCDAIVVSRQSAYLRENDGLSWLLYTSNSKQGGGALYQSFKNRLPVRVFRSSALTSQYAPPSGCKNRTMYRYDGLYTVDKVWDEKGASTDMSPLTGEIAYTFLLVRLPAKDRPLTTKLKYCNKFTEVSNSLTIDELWKEIIKSKGLDKETRFVQMCPPTELGPIEVWDLITDLRSKKSEKKCMTRECDENAVAIGSSIFDDAGTLEHELDRLVKNYVLTGKSVKPQKAKMISKKMKNVVRNVPIECSNSRERKNDKKPPSLVYRVSLTESEEAEGKAENMSDKARVPDELKTTDDSGASTAKKETIVNKRRKVGGSRSIQSEGRKRASNDVAAAPVSVARRSSRLQQQNHQKDSHEESSPLDQFYERIENTRDRLLFIRYTPPGASAATWALVQVDLDYTNERAARRQGRYHVRWFAAHPDDKKCCSIRLSRFWPVIHRIDKKGYFRKQIIVSPDDVHSLLDRRKDLGWYQMGVNLAASRLSEPFDFATLRSANSSCMVRYRVKNISWIEMMQNASVYGIGTSDVDNDPTIRRPGRKRRRG